MSSAASAASADGGPSFYLVPENTAAENIVDNPANRKFVQTTPEGERALHLSFPDLRNPKITLGRANCHITIPDNHGTAGIHKLHCYFRYSLDTGAVVLCDKSQNNSTQVFDTDQDLIVPLSQAERSVVVTQSFNRKIFIGNKKHYRFKMVWNSDPIRFFLSGYPRFGPQRTSPDPSKARYLLGDFLGSGGFAAVWKAADVRSGKAMAVKRFNSMEGKGHVYAIREVNNMLTLSRNNSRKHDNILPILGHEYDNKNFEWIEIFMPLREGSVRSLIKRADALFTDSDIAKMVLYQMAKALKYMAKCNMIHRDIKPDNILYRTLHTQDNQPYYQFQLADFGLSQDDAQARSRAGTEPFMAPEVYHRRKQTCITDIWSLFATIAWIYNTNNFRDFHPSKTTEVHDALQVIAESVEYTFIKDMASVDPNYRLSAKALLEKLEAGGAFGTTENPISELDDLSLDETPDDEWQGNYIHSIPQDVANQFANAHNYGYASKKHPHTSMDGHSALADLSSVPQGYKAGPSSAYQPEPYHHGRVGEEYMQYSAPYPRNKQRVVEGEAAFAGEKANDEEQGTSKKGKDGFV
ncbi:Protein kinase-like domain protein [Niveomyces insectorum RCEF 264]|uniref:Protein kinase-like domain protein n=1 Tax=Niveomyces insectorum RCEF 264 TaxID=1081102 RepID=A0A167P0M6_9HYPO|nr:Protein kinase-like domain protein [Niveomyces insectorum RCEF 264]